MHPRMVPGPKWPLILVLIMALYLAILLFTSISALRHIAESFPPRLSTLITFQVPAPQALRSEDVYSKLEVLKDDREVAMMESTEAELEENGYANLGLEGTKDDYKSRTDNLKSDSHTGIQTHDGHEHDAEAHVMQTLVNSTSRRFTRFGFYDLTPLSYDPSKSLIVAIWSAALGPALFSPWAFHLWMQNPALLEERRIKVFPNKFNVSRLASEETVRSLVSLNSTFVWTKDMGVDKAMRREYNAPMTCRQAPNVNLDSIAKRLFLRFECPFPLPLLDLLTNGHIHEGELSIFILGRHNLEFRFPELSAIGCVGLGCASLPGARQYRKAQKRIILDSINNFLISLGTPIDKQISAVEKGVVSHKNPIKSSVDLLYTSALGDLLQSRLVNLTGDPPKIEQVRNLTLCVGGISKKGVGYLREFIFHHLRLGVDSFIVGLHEHAHKSDPHPDQENLVGGANLDDLATLGIVSFAKIRTPKWAEECNRDFLKVIFYEQCLFRAKSVGTKYLAIWDPDEYIMPQNWSEAILEPPQDESRTVSEANMLFDTAAKVHQVSSKRSDSTSRNLMMEIIASVNNSDCHNWCYVSFPSVYVYPVPEELKVRDQIEKIHRENDSAPALSSIPLWRMYKFRSSNPDTQNYIWQKSIARVEMAFSASFHNFGTCVTNGSRISPPTVAYHREPNSCAQRVENLGKLYHYLAVFYGRAPPDRKFEPPYLPNEYAQFAARVHHTTGHPGAWATSLDGRKEFLREQKGKIDILIS